MSRRHDDVVTDGRRLIADSQVRRARSRERAADAQEMLRRARRIIDRLKGS